MLFDGEAFGQQMVEIVRGYVASEIEPLRAENKALAERIAELEAREIPSAVQGEPGANGIDGKDGEPGRDGVDCDMEAVRAMVDEIVTERVAALPPAEKGDPGEPGRDGIDGKDGRDGHDVEDIVVTQDGAMVELAFTVGDTRSVFELELPTGPEGPAGNDGEPGRDGATGKMEKAAPWEDRIHYDGAIRTYLGGTWQALRDTAHAPPHEDWTCLAAPGAAGNDGRSLNPRGLYAADAEYRHLDFVALNGSSFVATHDDPGPCPGDGWKLMASPGKRGEKGDKGGRGERGFAGPALKAIDFDDQGLLAATNADGSLVECDMYPVLSRIARSR